MSSITMNLKGLTCDNCVRHVTEDLSDLAGVDAVEVTRSPDTTAVAVVSGTALPDDQTLSEAVADAGNYQVVSIIR